MFLYDDSSVNQDTISYSYFSNLNEYFNSEENLCFIKIEKKKNKRRNRRETRKKKDRGAINFERQKVFKFRWEFPWVDPVRSTVAKKAEMRTIKKISRRRWVQR